jgi:hypothetical protein
MQLWFHFCDSLEIATIRISSRSNSKKNANAYGGNLEEAQSTILVLKNKEIERHRPIFLCHSIEQQAEQSRQCTQRSEQLSYKVHKVARSNFVISFLQLSHFSHLHHNSSKCAGIDELSLSATTSRGEGKFVHAQSRSFTWQVNGQSPVTI